MKAATKTKIKIKQPARKYWFVQFWILGELLLLLYSCLRTSNLIKVKCILSCKFAIRLFGGCGFYPGGSRRCHSETLNVKGMPLHGWAIFAPERMLAYITSNDLSVLVFLLTDLLFTCYLVFLRHQTSSWILRGCLASRLEELSDRSDWGDPEASYLHYLSNDNVHAILGGVAVCWATVSFRQARQTLPRFFLQIA